MSSCKQIFILFWFQFLSTYVCSSEETYLIDFVVMSHGHTLKDRDLYDQDILPITEKYGLALKSSLDLTPLSGNFSLPSRLNIWRVCDEDTLSDLSKDEHYQSLALFRNHIHDMNALTLFLAKKGNISQYLDRRKHFMVDLVSLNDSFSKEDRDRYEEKVVPVAAEYGMLLKQQFELIKYLRGTGPSHAIRLNLWEVNNFEAVSKLSLDKRYKEYIPHRNKIHDMKNVNLYRAVLRSVKTVSCEKK